MSKSVDVKKQAAKLAAQLSLIKPAEPSSSSSSAAEAADSSKDNILDSVAEYASAMYQSKKEEAAKAEAKKQNVSKLNKPETSASSLPIKNSKSNDEKAKEEKATDKKEEVADSKSSKTASKSKSKTSAESKQKKEEVATSKSSKTASKSKSKKSAEEKEKKEEVANPKTTKAASESSKAASSSSKAASASKNNKSGDEKEKIPKQADNSLSQKPDVKSDDSKKKTASKPAPSPAPSKKEEQGKNIVKPIDKVAEEKSGQEGVALPSVAPASCPVPKPPVDEKSLEKKAASLSLPDPPSAMYTVAPMTETMCAEMRVRVGAEWHFKVSPTLVAPPIQEELEKQGFAVRLGRMQKDVLYEHAINYLSCHYLSAALPHLVLPNGALAHPKVLTQMEDQTWELKDQPADRPMKLFSMSNASGPLPPTALLERQEQEIQQLAETSTLCTQILCSPPVMFGGAATALYEPYMRNHPSQTLAGTSRPTDQSDVLVPETAFLRPALSFCARSARQFTEKMYSAYFQDKTIERKTPTEPRCNFGAVFMRFANCPLYPEDQLNWVESRPRVASQQQQQQQQQQPQQSTSKPVVTYTYFTEGADLCILPHSKELLPLLPGYTGKDEEWMSPNREWLRSAAVIRLHVPAGSTVFLAPNTLHFQWFPTRLPTEPAPPSNYPITHLSVQTTIEEVVPSPEDDERRVQFGYVQGQVSLLRANVLKPWPGRGHHEITHLPVRRGPQHLSYLSAELWSITMTEQEEQMHWGQVRIRSKFSESADPGTRPLPIHVKRREKPEIETEETPSKKQKL
jgi:hypothetical protein